jgi:predicted ATPase
MSLAEEKGASQWKAYGRLRLGCVLALTGKSSNAVQMLTSGITAYRSTGATVFMPWYLSYLAKAYADPNQFDEARRCVGEAMTAVETTKERWCEAEIHRIAGEIAFISPVYRLSMTQPKQKHISSVLLRLHVSNRQSPGNCARR